MIALSIEAVVSHGQRRANPLLAIAAHCISLGLFAHVVSTPTITPRVRATALLNHLAVSNRSNSYVDATDCDEIRDHVTDLCWSTRRRIRRE